MFSVALPALRKGFRMEADLTAWLVTAQSLPFMMLMPLYGRMGDIFSRKRLLIFGIIVYLAGTIVVMVATNLPLFDGGWGVDALLGEQTRRNSDLDIVVKHKDVPRLTKLFESRGYVEIPRDDSWECNFVLADESGHEVDVHSCTFDAEGNNIYGVPYPILCGHTHYLR